MENQHLCFSIRRNTQGILILNHDQMVIDSITILNLIARHRRGANLVGLEGKRGIREMYRKCVHIY